jgi:hypothetical protein
VTPLWWYVFGFGWGLLILLSLAGWGSLLNWLCFPQTDAGWGQRIAWGMAWSAVAGGLLNLASCISKTAILTYLGAGIVLAGTALWRGRERSGEPRPGSYRKALLWLGIPLIALTFVQYAGTVSVARWDFPSSPAGPVRFNQSDDFQAYFNFPEKMLQLGTMGPDPFSTRRLESALGGQSFLDTFVLSVLPEQYLHLIDPGISLLLILLLLWGDLEDRRVSPFWSLAILLVFVWMDPPTVNVASLYTGTALFLSLYRTLNWEPISRARLGARVFLIALIAAGVCSLKSNLIPTCGAALACSFVCYILGQKSKRAAIMECAATGILIGVLLLPWMISMYQSSGTALYPLLGKGYHQSVYQDSQCAYCWLTAPVAAKLLIRHAVDRPVLPVVALGLFYLLSRRRVLQGREAVLSLLAGAAVGHAVMTLVTAENLSRYSVPFLLAATFALLAEAVSPPSGAWRARWHAAGPLVAAGTMIFMVGVTWKASARLYSECLASVRDALNGKPLVSKRDLETYAALERSIPPGMPLLAKLDKPFLFDFRRNPVLLIDWAASSLPPGLPYSRGSEALARYLTSKSIRYVAYSYGGEATRRGLPTYFPWFKIQLLYSYDFEDNVDGLAKTRKHLYDDGNSFVLDLMQWSTDTPAREATSSSSSPSQPVADRSRL